MAPDSTNPERDRIAHSSAQTEPWRDWGPYVAERAWGSVREDYSADGDAWRFFPHDHARSRTYRWNEDGMAAFCDAEQNWCLSLGLWNGVDPILKERMFGLAGPEGNHGEDVKEYWWYLDATPSHSWNTWRYHYPQRAFPYDDLVQTNARRGKLEPEYELVDTGVFDESRYWVVTVDYAKDGPHDLLMQITVENAGPDPATLHVLPTLWFRNTWSWGYENVEKPVLFDRDGSIVGQSPIVGTLLLQGDGTPETLFCENETNVKRLFDAENSTPYPKDGIGDHVIDGSATVNPEKTGTKSALHYVATVNPGGSAVFRIRLTAEAKPTEDDAPGSATAGAAATSTPGTSAAAPSAPGTSAATGVAAGADTAGLDAARFDATIVLRKSEADLFWENVPSTELDSDRARVLRQSMAGLLWSKQFFHFNVDEWLDGDPAGPPPPPGRSTIRNEAWRHLKAHDVILMPDPWEYPWFAAWDLAFHCVTLAHIDPHFAKDQLILMLREWYMHPSGQLAAYEWDFSDVNPPTHAWAAMQVFLLDGGTDFDFLARVFHKLLMNFTWWTNTKDRGANNLYEGGFMGLDNISPLDRSTLPASIGYLEQADSTAWMAMYALDLLDIALRLAVDQVAYEDVAIKFVEQFLRIAASANDSGLWDDEDAYFYDILHLADGREVPMKVRSLVGLVPVVASLVYDDPSLHMLPEFRMRVRWFLDHNPQLQQAFHFRGEPGHRTFLLALVPEGRLARVLAQVFDETGLLSPHGIRGISAYHREHPFSVQVGDQTATVDYEPAESTSGLFGGNSNWRGPVWFPLNVLLIESLRDYDVHAVEDLSVEFPRGSGVKMSLAGAADALSNRLISLFLPGADGRRPADARYDLLSTDPRWKDNLFFYEYFDGDTGEGLGASHQTGWTALVAHLILTTGVRRESKGTYL